MDRVFGEYIHADDLQDSAHALLDAQGLIENGDHQVNADRDPNLRLDGVFGQTEEGLHAKVLLDPFEEEFDLPARLVDLRDDQRFDLEVVGDEDQELSGLRVQEAYPPQVVGKERLGLRSVEADRLVGPQAGRLVHGTRLADVVAHVGLRSRHEEGPGRMDPRQPEKIDVSTIQYIESSCLEEDPIQSVDVVDSSLRDSDECGNRAAQVDHGMELDGRLSSSKTGPWKEVHAQVDSGGVDGIDNLVDFQNVSIRCIQLPSLADENLSELEIDFPASMLVGVREVGPRRRSANAHRVEQVGLRFEAGLDVSQAFPVGELGECHAKELVPRRKAPARPRHGMVGNAAIELLAVNHIGYLREDETASIHGRQSQ